MRILRAGTGFIDTRRSRQIILTILFFNITGSCRTRLIRDTQRVSSHIGNQTYGTQFRQFNALVQLLSSRHGTLGLETEFTGSLLLKGRGGKRRCRRTLAGSLFQATYLIFSAFQHFQYLVGFFLIGQFHFFTVNAIKTSDKTFPGLGRLRIEFCLDCPVFFRNKRPDFILTVNNHPDGNRLNTAGT